MKKQDLLKIAAAAAAVAANILRSKHRADAGIISSYGKDMKTQADISAQATILKILNSTGITVLAEESAGDGLGDVLDLNSLLWVVDPLDGTINFARGFEMAAVSIALWEDGQPILGVVHDIFHDNVYSGIVSEGAWLNGQLIFVSNNKKIEEALLATGFPSGRSYDAEDLSKFVKHVQSYKKIRMLGSASIMLSEVAAGHFDVYEEEDIYFWDVAAGLALVCAAGGVIRLELGSGPYKYKVRASNGFV